MPDVTLDTTLEPFGPATAIILSDDQVAQLGGGKRAAVRVAIGDRSARLRLAVMGGQNCIGLSKASRAELGVELGETVTATVSLDDAPRDVVLPDEMTAVLASDSVAAQAFEKLAFTHRKEYATWVGEAKKPETRERRAAQALEMLRSGQTRSSMGR
ncbi:MAG: YdeI/OmpD-associated family protein [Actinobacteria bacterium]|jgi:Uncharacterized protein conserved in bacteria|nr:YdeI/OmpD-associated family protein [Actinomycetota bacterium]